MYAPITLATVPLRKIFFFFILNPALGQAPVYTYWLGHAASKIPLPRPLQSLHTTSSKSPLKLLVARMQQWMMDVIKSHGFIGVLLLASWPNAAFDLCGICCGAFKMPFWTFFGATLVGKGIVKVNGQAAFFVAIFRRDSREAVMNALERVLPAKLPFLHLQSSPAQALHQLVNRQIVNFQARVATRAAAHRAETQWFWQRALSVLQSGDALQRYFATWVPDNLGAAWGWTIFILIGMFVVSCVNTFAQSYKAEQDERSLADTQQQSRATRKRL